jgi:hypothetical protein
VCLLFSFTPYSVLIHYSMTGHSSDAEHEHAHPAWCVGWPHDMERAMAALWVLWLFEGKGELLFCFEEHALCWR